MSIRIKDFRKAYDEAVENNQKQFLFQGRDMLTAYAKYVLEYLSMMKLSDEDYFNFEATEEKIANNE